MINICIYFIFQASCSALGSLSGTAKPSMLANPQMRPNLAQSTSTRVSGCIPTGSSSLLRNSSLLYSTAGLQTNSGMGMDVGRGDVGNSSPRKRGVTVEIEHVSVVDVLYVLIDSMLRVANVLERQCRVR